MNEQLNRILDDNKENDGLTRVLHKDITSNNENSETKSSNNVNDLLDLIKSANNSEEFNPSLILTIILAKALDNFEKKDIISRSMAKPYALLSSTNKIQKALINEIIAKQNDNKGQTKKMYFDIINNTLKSLKQTENKNENSVWNKLGLRR